MNAMVYRNALAVTHTMVENDQVNLNRNPRSSSKDDNLSKALGQVKCSGASAQVMPISWRNCCLCYLTQINIDVASSSKNKFVLSNF